MSFYSGGQLAITTGGASGDAQLQWNCLCDVFGLSTDEELTKMVDESALALPMSLACRCRGPWRGPHAPVMTLQHSDRALRKGCEVQRVADPDAPKNARGASVVLLC